MTIDIHRQNKNRLRPLRAALYDYDAGEVRSRLGTLFAPEARIRLAYPFEDLVGASGLFEAAIAPLAAAWPDLERRDTIVIAGDFSLTTSASCCPKQRQLCWIPHRRLP